MNVSLKTAAATIITACLLGLSGNPHCYAQGFGGLLRRLEGAINHRRALEERAPIRGLGHLGDLLDRRPGHWHPQPQPGRPPYQPHYNRPYNPPPRPTVPKNTIVKQTKQAPKRNLGPDEVFKLRAIRDQLPLSAETDSKQATQAAEAGGQLDVGINEMLKDPRVPPGAANDWKLITAGGTPSPEQIRQFLMTYGPGLDQPTQQMLQTRLAFAEYQRQLEAGGLTFAGKQQALANLQAQVAALPGASLLEASLLDRLATMQDFNNLGLLADISAGTGDPLGTMLAGANNAGLPPELVGEMTDLPLYDAEPQPDATADQPTYACLINPETNSSEASYLIDGRTYTMPPGFSQNLATRRTIEFDTGTGRFQRYTLSKGTYAWVETENGLELRRRTIEVTIDNSEYGADFHYLVDGRQATVSAGNTATHVSDLPIEVEFDRGDGGPPARKILKGGVFQVGIHVDGLQLDLFRKDEIEAIYKDEGSPQLDDAVASDKDQQIQDLLQQLKKQ